MSDNIVTVTDASYAQDVLQSDTPVLVDFWAAWCGPCRMIAPIVEELANEYAGRLKVAKVNTDENPGTPSSLGIRGIPTLLFYVNGQEADRVVGVRPKDELKRKVDRILEGAY
ncbi:MAG: thioredoxin [Anaerolineae bacterium]|jgi:thioredoxin 1|nr:thioredoxin [Chloroflexota bacterium]